jgi:hypothetical protein
VRTILSIAMIVGGGVIFAGDPSGFAKFSLCALPGTTTIAGAMLLLGVALWLRE